MMRFTPGVMAYAFVRPVGASAPEQRAEGGVRFSDRSGSA